MAAALVAATIGEGEGDGAGVAAAGAASAAAAVSAAAAPDEDEDGVSDGFVVVVSVVDVDVVGGAATVAAAAVVGGKDGCESAVAGGRRDADDDNNDDDDDDGGEDDDTAAFLGSSIEYANSLSFVRDSNRSAGPTMLPRRPPTRLARPPRETTRLFARSCVRVTDSMVYSLLSRGKVRCCSGSWMRQKMQPVSPSMASRR